MSSHDEEIMLIPCICPNCGAPVRGDECEYCGTPFARVKDKNKARAAKEDRGRVLRGKSCPEANERTIRHFNPASQQWEWVAKRQVYLLTKVNTPEFIDALETMR